MYDRDMYDWGWGTWLAMSLMMAVFTAVVVALVVLVLRATARPEQPVTSSAPRIPQDTSSGNGMAERLLDERFARGDIDESDYLARRDLLQKRR